MWNGNGTVIAHSNYRRPRWSWHRNVWILPRSNRDRPSIQQLHLMTFACNCIHNSSILPEHDDKERAILIFWWTWCWMFPKVVSHDLRESYLLCSFKWCWFALPPSSMAFGLRYIPAKQAGEVLPSMSTTRHETVASFHRARSRAILLPSYVKLGKRWWRMRSIQKASGRSSSKKDNKKRRPTRNRFFRSGTTKKSRRTRKYNHAEDKMWKLGMINKKPTYHR